MSLFSLQGIKTLFGLNGVGDTTLKIVDKIAGTDWTPNEKAEFILKHAEVTKYQSPMRRFIAGSYTIAWLTLVLVWLASSVYGRVFDAPNAMLLSGDIKEFMASNINIAMNGILAFYFLINMRK